MLKPFTRSWGTGQTFSYVIPAIALVVLGLLGTSITFAQNAHQQGQNIPESPQAARVRALNNGLLQLHAQMQQDPASGTADTIRGQAATVIAQRAAALKSLIEENPHAALSFAFSSELLVDLAAKFPQSASLLESQTAISGELQHWVEDGADMKTSRSYFRLSTGSQILNLHFAGQEPTFKSGELLKATGVLVGSDMAVLSTAIVPAKGSTLLPTLSSSFPGSPVSALLLFGVIALAIIPFANASKFRGRILLVCKRSAVCAVALGLIVVNPGIGHAQSTCSSTGIQNAAVLLVTFPGLTPPTGVDTQSIYKMFFGTTPPSLDGYWREASYGQTGATGNVYGWFTLSGSYSCSNITQFITDAVTAAANTGVNFQTYNRVFVVFPDMSPSCGWAGLSSIGCYTLSIPAGTLTLSTSVLVWNDMATPDQGVPIIAHEAGHQLGLAHARLRTFTDSTGTALPLGALGTTGTLLEYGDHFAAIGLPSFGHYAAGHKAEELNWLASGVNYQVVQSSGTYTLQPYESTPAGLDALKVQRGTANNAWLWIEYRQSIGNYDATLYPTQLFSGALIHYEDSTTGVHTDLLDFTAPSAYSDDPSLAVGQTWTDPYTNLSLSVIGATPTGLTVGVNYGPVLCGSSAPTVNVSPLDPSVYPGQSASYSVSVTNNDSSGCPSSTIDLGSNEPSGWTTSLSSSSVTLSPGQSASVTMGKGAPSGTAAGTYAVNLNASNASASASATANATVMTPPTLAANISVSGSNFTRPGTVPITALVTNGGTPASGAIVTFTLTTPRGGSTTQTATTGSNGSTTWNYKLNSRSFAGTYSVGAQAALSSGSKKAASTQTTTSNTATFTVQ